MAGKRYLPYMGKEGDICKNCSEILDSRADDIIPDTPRSAKEVNTHVGYPRELDIFLFNYHSAEHKYMIFIYISDSR